MRTRATWTFLRAVALAGLFFAVATSLMAQDPEIIFTDKPAFTQAAVAEPKPLAMYCVYNVGTVSGNCGDFGPGSRLCIDCPASGKCPGPPGQISRFRYVDGAGNTICTGTWARAFNLAKPDACIVCTNGQTGYVFVN